MKLYTTIFYDGRAVEIPHKEIIVNKSAVVYPCTVNGRVSDEKILIQQYVISANFMMMYKKLIDNTRFGYVKFLDPIQGYHGFFAPHDSIIL